MKKIKKLSEEKTDDRDELSNESDEGIHHKKKELKEFEEKNKHFTATKNGTKKEFIIDTGSPITTMPPDEKS